MSGYIMEGTKKRGLSPAQKKKVCFFFFFCLSFSSFFLRRFLLFLSFFAHFPCLLLSLSSKNQKQKIAKAKEEILANNR